MHRKELSKRQIKANEKEERKPFQLNLIIYDSSKILFESEHDVHVDRDCTIGQIINMCFNDEVATKIHVRHWTISLPSYLTISPSVFPQFRSMYGTNEILERTRQLRFYSVLDLPYSTVILRPISFGPPPVIIRPRYFDEDLDVQEKNFKPKLEARLTMMWVSYLSSYSHYALLIPHSSTVQINGRTLWIRMYCYYDIEIVVSFLLPINLFQGYG